jgi:hypothetical protein
MSQAPPSQPRFNHIALTVPPELLNESGRKQILDFYGEVFGWTEHAMLTEDRSRLVMGCHRIDQFVFLLAGDKTTDCGPFDHFGMAVGSLGELRATLERARRYAERDPRVEITDHGVEDHGILKLHAAYVRFLLPMMFEVQYYEFPEGEAPS